MAVRPWIQLSENPESSQVSFKLREWDQAFEKKDLDLIAKYLHKGYCHTYYPQSLGGPEQTEEDFVEVPHLWTGSNVRYVGFCSDSLRRG